MFVCETAGARRVLVWACVCVCVLAQPASGVLAACRI